MRKTHKNNNSINCDTLYTIQTSKTMIVYTDIMKKTKKNKGEYIMSKVKQYAEDTAEKNVDKIILGFKQGVLNKDTTKAKILDVENVNMLGINADNVDEVISENA